MIQRDVQVQYENGENVVQGDTLTLNVKLHTENWLSVWLCDIMLVLSCDVSHFVNAI